MRYLIPLFILILSTNTKAQTEVLLGQPYKGQNTLIIKNTSGFSSKLSQIGNYSNVEALKLMNFNDEFVGLDSIFTFLSPLTKVKRIYFINSNLLSLTSSFSKFTSLQEIHVLGGSEYFENTLFPLLKNNSISQIYFETKDPEIITDSLDLLSSLQNIHVSGEGFTKKVENTIVLEVDHNNKTSKINIIEYGGFAESDGHTYNEQRRDDLVGEDKFGFNSTRNFIKQPIPGIKINDTLYNFESTAVGSFTYYSGSMITIDKNSFNYENGSPYNGPVKIFYREFRTPVEIMLSGIPMMNTENGQTNLFKSGGMYEINATDINGKKLIAKNDTAIKINFKLTDTSSSFKFYSLNNSGHWDVSNDTIAYVNPLAANSNYKQWTEAVAEYYKRLRYRVDPLADTTKFEFRFNDKNYLYTYRKDNLYRDKRDSSYEIVGGNAKLFGKNNITTKALFRVRYVKLTKDKELIFKIMPNKKNLIIPDHIKVLANKMIIYTGSLTPQEFKQTFNRNFHCWDLRNLSMDGTLDLEIKTLYGFINITGILVNLSDDGKYVVLPKATKTVNQDISRNLEKEGRLFNRTERFIYRNWNDINKLRDYRGSEREAFEACKRYQNKEELKMSILDWRKYLTGFAPPDVFTMESNNELGRALLKSGLGVKNIDCYIHSGQMENILVNYPEKTMDTLMLQYHNMLYKSINTSYPLVAIQYEKGFAGFYYKRNENYLIRFSNDGFMQVTRPEEVNQNKKGNSINLRYVNTYFVKGMDSNNITRLIFN